MTTSRTDRSIIAQLTRDACDYHRDSLATPDFAPDLIALDEPYISDSTIDELTQSLDAISILTAILTDDYATDRCADMRAALDAHTLIADLPDALRLILPDATYPDDYCACAIIPFRTELITPCPNE